MNSPPNSLVKPSSLNYKISLSEAVTALFEKEMPVGEDQQIEVITEDPKVSSAAGMVNGVNPSKDKDFDEFDDAMFHMNAPNHEGGRHTNPNRTKGGHPQTPMVTNNNNAPGSEKD